MNRVIITPGEADAFLSAFPVWLNLDSSTKEFHISRASVYVQNNWVCVETVVFDGDDMDIPDLIKEAVAYYAFADYSGTLYGSVDQADSPRGSFRGIRQRLEGVVDQEYTWYRGGKGSPSGVNVSSGYPDDLMRVYCSEKESTTLARRV